jgi:hypothetical protein
VLYDIKEDSSFPFFMRKATLVGVNILFMSISFVNFVYCLYLGNLEVYSESWIYTAGIYIQLGASFIVTVLMLNAGILLSRRIHSVSGGDRRANNGVFQPGSVRVSTSAINTPPRGSAADMSGGAGRSTIVSTPSAYGQRGSEFQSALRVLIFVMATCASCIFLQIILLFLNLIQGMTDKTTEYPYGMSPWLYWVFYAWVPLWGPILALLYLSRTNSAKRKHAPSDSTTSNTTINDPFYTAPAFPRDSTLEVNLLHDQYLNSSNANQQVDGDNVWMRFAREISGEEETSPFNSMSHNAFVPEYLDRPSSSVHTPAHLRDSSAW